MKTGKLLPVPSGVTESPGGRNHRSLTQNGERAGRAAGAFPIGAPTMEELVAYIVKALVDLPDEVTVTTLETSGSVTYEVAVAPSDMGQK